MPIDIFWWSLNSATQGARVPGLFLVVNHRLLEMQALTGDLNARLRVLKMMSKRRTPKGPLRHESPYQCPQRVDSVNALGQINTRVFDCHGKPTHTFSLWIKSSLNVCVLL